MRAPGPLIVLAAIVAALVPRVSSAQATQLHRSQPSGLIVGKVVDSTGAAVPGARVHLYGATRTTLEDATERVSRELIASTDGEFYFTGLPEGEFDITARKRGYGSGSQQAWSDPIVYVDLGAGERRADVRIVMFKHAVVTGQVHMPDDARVNGNVVAYRPVLRSGAWGLQRADARGGEIDDRGQYRMFELPAGRYLFVFTPLDEAPPALAEEGIVHPPACFPSGPSTSFADLLAIEAGEERPDVDFQVTSEPAFRVRASVVGGNVDRAEVRLIPSTRSAAFAMCRAREYWARTRDGDYDFGLVQAGSYTLEAMSRGPDGEASASASVPLTVQAPAEPVQVTLQRTWTLTGELRLESSTGQAPAPHELALRFDPADGAAAIFSRHRVSIEKTSLRITGVRPGRYVIDGDTFGAWRLKSAMLGGRDVTRTSFEVAGDSDQLVVTFTDAPSAIDVTVDRSGAARDVPVNLFAFPAEEKLWRDYGERSSRLMRASVRSGLQRAMAVPVPPGEYCVVAVSGSIPDEWRDPVVLRQLATRASRVIVAEGVPLPVTLRAIPFPGVR